MSGDGPLSALEDIAARRQPRVSGDGPAKCITSATPHKAAPRERGWTPLGLLGLLARDGSPA